MVVVVIAILAAITIVAYNGISQQAKESALKSDLEGAVKALQMKKAETDVYPADESGLPGAATTTYQYDHTANTFCITARSSTLEGVAFHATEAGRIEEGACSGHSAVHSSPNGGIVTTIAGMYGDAAFADGSGSEARFQFIDGIDYGPDGNIYVADQDNFRIRRVTPSGVVSTVAGSGVRSLGDGDAESASFLWPRDLVVADDGTIYVADDSAIRVITPGGSVSTLVEGGNMDVFMGIDLDSSGDLIVSDVTKVIKVTPSGDVSTIAGSNSSGYVNGSCGEARFSRAAGLAVGPDDSIYIADSNNNVVRKIDAACQVTTLAGVGTYGTTNGPGNQAQFWILRHVAIGPSGVVYVTEEGNGSSATDVRSITPGGTVSLLAGFTRGGADGAGASAQFDTPSGITVTPEGTIYVGEYGGQRIRKIE